MKNQVSVLRKMFMLSWAMCFIVLQIITAAELSGVNTAASTLSLQCQICRFIPGLTPSQIDICCDVPKAISLLADLEHGMRTECRWQLRKELWNCSEIGMPIFRSPNMRETPEKAFIYALASASTVHRITTACSNSELESECGCDYSRNGLLTVQGWQWGSCSDNVSYGIYFAQNFLDNREIDVDVTNDTAIAHAVVHLHNNAVGRKVLSDNMILSCRCHGLSGSCSVRTCWRELPTYYQVGDILKAKYDHALKVSVTSNGNGPALLYYYDPTLRAHVVPSENSLVYLEKPSNYCTIQQNFTQNRKCMPQSLLDLTRRAQVKAGSMHEYFPPCEEFCCNGDYVEERTTMMKTCNCRFVWCCNVICETCVINMTHYRCTG